MTQIDIDAGFPKKTPDHNEAHYDDDVVGHHRGAVAELGARSTYFLFFFPLTQPSSQGFDVAPSLLSRLGFRSSPPPSLKSQAVAAAEVLLQKLGTMLQRTDKPYGGHLSQARRKGLYPSQIQFNLAGGPLKAALRNDFLFIDDNVFITSAQAFSRGVRLSADSTFAGAGSTSFSRKCSSTMCQT